MSTNIGNAISDSIIETLKVGMQGKIANFPLNNVFWHISEDIPHAAQCPAIGIYDNGWTKVMETTRGRDALGNIVSGLELRRYEITIRVWQKGRKEDELKRELREISDVIAGVLTDTNILENTAAIGTVEGGDPTVAIGSGGALLAACELKVKVESYNVQGQSTYSGVGGL